MRLLSQFFLLSFFLLPSISSSSPLMEKSSRSYPFSSIPLKKGVFLIASPQLRGPVFQRTVILLVRYDREQVMGVIINRPTRIPLAEALPSLNEKVKGNIFFGGPVSPYTPFALFLSDAPGKNTFSVRKNLYFTSDIELATRQKGIGKEKNNARVYAGYAGWSPGQLESEIDKGSWIISRGDNGRVFDRRPESLWEILIEERSQILVEHFFDHQNEKLAIFPPLI